MARYDKQDELQKLLRKYCDRVYYRPPSKLQYPCIVYDRSGENPLYSNNKRYMTREEFTGQIMTTTPDPEFMFVMREELPTISFGSTFISNNVTHYNFTIKI